MNLRKIAAAGLASALLVGLLGVGGTSAVAADGDTAAITGKVTLNGKAVAGVSVRVYPPTNPSQTHYATTDATGTYTTDDGWSTLMPGTYVVVADNSSWDDGTGQFDTFPFLSTFSGNTVREPDATKVTVTAGKTSTVNIATVPGASIKGKVVDAKGKPVKGVSVNAYNLTRSGSGYANATDAKGNYVVSGLATGKVEVSVGTWSEKVSTWGNTTVKAKQGKTVTAKVIRLEKTVSGTITGTVKGLKKGDTVWLYDTKGKYSYQVAEATKSSVKVKTSVSPGTYRLVVGGTNVASKAVTVKSKKTSKAGTLKAPKKRTKITGSVKRANGKSAAKAWVDVTDSYGTRLSSVTANAKGKYSVTGVVSGRYTVTAGDAAGKDAWASANVTVRKGKNAKKSVRLAKTYKVTGTVKHAGKGVAGVYLGAIGGTGLVGGGAALTTQDAGRAAPASGGSGSTTDAQGRFTLTGVRAGKQVLTAFDPYTGGYLDARKSITIKKNSTWNLTLKK